MPDWLSTNLRDRAAYDGVCEADRATSAAHCPRCGVAECASPLCEVKRRKAEQQARAQVLGARAGLVGGA